MAGKAKYILSSAAKGQVWAAKPLYARKDGGKFDLDNPDSLSQNDLEYLYENNLTQFILKVESEAQKEDKPKKAKTKKQ